MSSFIERIMNYGIRLRLPRFARSPRFDYRVEAGNDKPFFLSLRSQGTFAQNKNIFEAGSFARLDSHSARLGRPPRPGLGLELCIQFGKSIISKAVTCVRLATLDSVTTWIESSFRKSINFNFDVLYVTGGSGLFPCCNALPYAF